MQRRFVSCVSSLAFGAWALAAAAPHCVAAPPPAPSKYHVSLAPSSSTTAAGTSVTLTLTLDKPAPDVMPVTLSATGPAGVVSCPSLVKVAAGMTTASFKVKGLVPGGPVTVTATLPAAAGGASATAQVSVVGIVVSLTPSRLEIVKGTTAKLTVTLSKPAPVGGVTVAFSQSGPANVILLPASVTIPAGSTTAQITVHGINLGGPISVTATLPPRLGGAKDSSTVSVVLLSRSPVRRR